MVVGLLLCFIFALIFTTIQSFLLSQRRTDVKTYAREQLEHLKKGKHFTEFVAA